MRTASDRRAERLAWSVYYQLRYADSMSVQQLDSAAAVLEVAAELLRDDYFDADAKPDTLACAQALRQLSATYGELSLEQAASTQVASTAFKQYVERLYWL